MEQWSGFSQKGYTFEIKIPTTIYDPKRLELTAYVHKGQRRDGSAIKGKEIEKIYIPIKSLPVWDESRQVELLSRRDEASLKKATNTLVDKLPEI